MLALTEHDQAFFSGIRSTFYRVAMICGQGGLVILAGTIHARTGSFALAWSLAFALEAMRYAALGGGKRFRPFLVVESAALFAVPRERALMAAVALECVHCYSLVHDDLPAMDNDDLRRGRPTRAQGL